MRRSSTELPTPSCSRSWPLWAAKGGGGPTGGGGGGGWLVGERADGHVQGDIPVVTTTWARRRARRDRVRYAGEAWVVGENGALYTNDRRRRVGRAGRPDDRPPPYARDSGRRPLFIGGDGTFLVTTDPGDVDGPRRRRRKLPLDVSGIREQRRARAQRGWRVLAVLTPVRSPATRRSGARAIHQTQAATS